MSLKHTRGIQRLLTSRTMNWTPSATDGDDAAPLAFSDRTTGNVRRMAATYWLNSTSLRDLFAVFHPARRRHFNPRLPGQAWPFVTTRTCALPVTPQHKGATAMRSSGPAAVHASCLQRAVPRSNIPTNPYNGVVMLARVGNQDRSEITPSLGCTYSVRQSVHRMVTEQRPACAGRFARDSIMESSQAAPEKNKKHLY